jgi:hypothetical protein
MRSCRSSSTWPAQGLGAGPSVKSAGNRSATSYTCERETSSRSTTSRPDTSTVNPIRFKMRSARTISAASRMGGMARPSACLLHALKRG